MPKQTMLPVHTVTEDAMDVEELTGLEIRVDLFLRCATLGEATAEIAAIATQAGGGTGVN